MAHVRPGGTHHPHAHTPCAPTRLHGRVAQRSPVAACRAARRRPPRDRGAGTGQPLTGLNRARCRRDSGHLTAQGCRLHAPPPRRHQQPRGPGRASPRALSNPTGKLTIASYRSTAGAAGIVSGVGLLLLGLQVCVPPLATPRPSPRPALPPPRYTTRLRQSIISGDNPILLYFGLLVIFFQRSPDLPTANEYTGLDLTRQIAAFSAFLFMLLTLLPCPVELVYPAVPL
jgi:hypothetical protein